MGQDVPKKGILGLKEVLQDELHMSLESLMQFVGKETPTLIGRGRLTDRQNNESESIVSCDM